MKSNVYNEWILNHWDREAFLVVMRRIEILLINNLQETAVSALRQFVAWTRPDPPTLDSAVHDVLPTRMANRLEQHGYETLRAAARADRRELMQIEQIGPRAIDTIQAAAAAAERGERLPDLIKERSAELESEFEIDWDYFASFAPHWEQILGSDQISNFKFQDSKEDHMTTVSTETNLAILLKSIDDADAMAQIHSEMDKREAELEAELDRLKRLRKLLGVPKKAKAARNYREAEQEHLVFDAVANGPLRPKEIAAQTGLNYTHVGRIASHSTRLVRQPDGTISHRS